MQFEAGALKPLRRTLSPKFALISIVVPDIQVTEAPSFPIQRQIA